MRSSLLFLVLLEAGLRLIGFGDFRDQWVEVAPGKTVLDAAVPRRYLTTVNFMPGSVDDPFDTQRWPGRLRDFVLGESSAAGFPHMPLWAFSRYLSSRLALSYPDSMIGVVYIGLTGISSPEFSSGSRMSCSSAPATMSTAAPSGWLDGVCRNITRDGKGPPGSHPVEYLLHNLSWEGAHRSVAAIHYRNHNPAGLIAEIEALLHQYPYVPEYLDLAGESLARLGQFDEASRYLTRRLAAGSSASAAKWMGIISLQRKQTAEAIRYLTLSVRWKPNDPHALFNLASAYLLARDTRAASEAIERCLALEPRYPRGRELAALLRRLRR